jgi:hypothetical protein
MFVFHTRLLRTSAGEALDLPKKQYYPSRVDEEAENPDGTKLRSYAL